MKTSLVIMAAGIGSRFGGGIKQLQPVGPQGEIIMDYSVHDAIEAGFTDIIFVIRKDIEKDFREIIGDRISAACAARGVTVHYAFQDLRDLPAPFTLPEGRTKPWGTGQAVLACADLLDAPFAVINADDYYGKEGFKAIHEFITEDSETDDTKANTAANIPSLCMAGFILKNTVSLNGSVTRGICAMDENHYLTSLAETKNIVTDGTTISTDGRELSPDALVSMNMWGLPASFVPVLKQGFVDFLGSLKNPLKDEYLLPILIGDLLKEGKVTVKVLQTKDEWFGMTYHEDIPVVIDEFKRLYAEGKYQEPLF